MSTSPVMFFIGKKFLSQRGEFFQKAIEPNDSLLLTNGTSFDIAKVTKHTGQERSGANSQITSLEFASSSFAYANPKKVSVLRTALPEIFEKTEGEIALKTINNPLPKITNLRQAKEAAQSSTYIIIRKSQIVEPELIEELKKLSCVNVIDHKDYYEIFLTDTPFSTPEVSPNDKNTLKMFGRYYSLLEQEFQTQLAIS